MDLNGSDEDAAPFAAGSAEGNPYEDALRFAVGKRFKVYWDGDQCWYFGNATKVLEGPPVELKIDYDDGVSARASFTCCALTKHASMRDSMRAPPPAPADRRRMSCCTPPSGGRSSA